LTLAAARANVKELFTQQKGMGVMLKRVVLAGFIAVLGGAVQAGQDQVAKPEAGLVPVVTHEVCTTTNWGFGEIRTECRTEESLAPKPSQSLKGICTTYYGRRTCY
jgi:hypothetical protein